MGGNGLRFMVVAGSVTAAVFAAGTHTREKKKIPAQENKKKIKKKKKSLFFLFFSGRISSLLFSRLFSIFFCSVCVCVFFFLLLGLPGENERGRSLQLQSRSPFPSRKRERDMNRAHLDFSFCLLRFPPFFSPSHLPTFMYTCPPTLARSPSECVR